MVEHIFERLAYGSKLVLGNLLAGSPVHAFNIAPFRRWRHRVASRHSARLAANPFRGPFGKPFIILGNAEHNGLGR